MIIAVLFMLSKRNGIETSRTTWGTIFAHSENVNIFLKYMSKFSGGKNDINGNFLASFFLINCNFSIFISIWCSKSLQIIFEVHPITKYMYTKTIDFSSCGYTFSLTQMQSVCVCLCAFYDTPFREIPKCQVLWQTKTTFLWSRLERKTAESVCDAALVLWWNFV